MRDFSSIPQTCPYINSVRDFLESIDWGEDEQGLEKECKDMILVLEDIRKHNERLRDWGNSEYSRADDAERQVADMEKAIDRLESDIKTYESDISDLETRVKELEDELSIFENQN